jgi:glutamate/tyrosine decarboxylase-like PLP-dependent enzyme
MGLEHTNLEPAEGGECYLLDLGAQQYEEGVNVLLCDPLETFEANPKALFLGPKAENAELVERMLCDVFRDHGFWRRNFHPGDPPVVQPRDQDHRSFRDFWAHFQRELQILLGELKSDVPFFSPRYIGHMTADICLPALVAHIATMLYNPNNVSWEASPVTTLLEVQVGRDLSKMVGFGRTTEELDRTWGHITSGGTLANLESIWVAKAVKFLPVAVRFAAEELGAGRLFAGPQGKPIDEMNAWELSNLSPREALDLKDRFIEEYCRAYQEIGSRDATRKALRALKAQDILSLGDHAFFSRLRGDDALNTPVIVVPQTMHYSWVKGAGAMGVGSNQIVAVLIDRYFRMDTEALEVELNEALRNRRPVLEVVAVAGTTEEGAVDPIHTIVEIRDQMAAQGLGFSLHCDAAYGGYFGACFRSANGDLRSLADMQKEYNGWPSKPVYDSFEALRHVDSITIDPHKLGYVPYPAGAVVFRDGRSKELVAQEASYALGSRGPKDPGEIHIGKYILEGSKPGAAAAAVFLSHRVVPPDERGYGRVLGQTIRSSQSFYRRLLVLADKIKADFRICPLLFPDTNIINYLVNPIDNSRLDFMNQFAHNLYRELSIDTRSPVQTRRFIVSHTELGHDSYNPEIIRSVLSRHLGIAGDYFVSQEEAARCRARGMEGYDHEVVVFRATLMNPFVLEKVVASKDYIDLFLEGLGSLLLKGCTYTRGYSDSYE